MKPLLVSLWAFALGFQHGLGPDHLAALTALISRRGGAARPFLLSLAFAAGHSATLIVLGGLGVLLGLALPSSVTLWAEVLGGAMLVGLGLWLLSTEGLNPFYFHTHEHEHGAKRGHRHPHVHLHWHWGKGHSEHRHIHIASLIGGAFALGGLGRLLVLVPTLFLAASAWQGLLYIAAFALGILFSMSLYGMTAARLLHVLYPRQSAYRAFSLAVAATSIVTGIIWIALSV